MSGVAGSTGLGALLFDALVLAACLLGAAGPWTVTHSAARLDDVLGRGGTDEGRGRGVGRRARARRRAQPPDLDVLVLLDLLDAAIAAGASLPRALAAVADAAGGADGRVLARAASALVMGADWRAAWRGAPQRLEPLVTALGSTWDTGSAPGPALRAAAERVRRERRISAREAAGRLGVRLVLPLGVCFLPAFVLIGLVPVLISLGSSLLG